MFPTSRIQYIDRGAGGAGDEISDCRTPPYKDANRLDEFYRVPMFKRICVKAYLGKGDDYVYQPKDAVALASYVHTRIGDGTAPSAVINYLSKTFVGKKLSEIPEHDPGSTASGNEPPPYVVNDPKNKSQDSLTQFITGIGKAAAFITNPYNWLAIFAILMGLGITLFAAWKGLQ